MADNDLETAAAGRPLGKPRKRKKTKIIIGESAKHPVGQIGPKEQTIKLKNIGKRGGGKDRGIIIDAAVKPQTNTGPGIGIADVRSRRK